MNTLHVVVPHGVADPRRPSGGNSYDRKVCEGLRVRGWSVSQREVAGRWPRRDHASRAALGATLAAIPDGSVVLLDGLVASALPEVLVPERRRLRLVVLVHLPLGLESDVEVDGDLRARERAVLHAAAVVVATSRWTRDWLLATYRLVPGRVRVVPPGVEQGDLVEVTASAGRFARVGAVTPTKGHDVLVDALAEIAELEWTCQCVGSVEVDPKFAARVRARVEALGLGNRITFAGPRVDAHLDAVYAATDLVLAPSRAETYGMVVTESLARGVPVVGTDVGGLPEALGTAPGGRRPGILVPPGDPAALALALRRWLMEPELRDDLRRAARERRATLGDWVVTADRLARVLSEAAA